MNKDYVSLIAESKSAFHKQRARMAYEEKFNIIVELQKIDQAMRKSNLNRSTDRKLRCVWPLDDKNDR